jgi:uncharacterized protein YbgA (DUF1722 family)/uncharacterized protein YbbK (DUF523 family)
MNEEITKIPVGISRCLLGDPVRYNGDHKHNRFCTSVLADYFDFVPTCPEVETGMTVPRKPIRLVQVDDGVRALGSDDASQDFSDPLIARGQQYAHDHQNICGFIATPNSPSCGVFGVKLYLPNGNPINKTTGLFSASLQRNNPLLPMEEAGRLNDAGLRENFIMRVYTYHRWQQLQQQGLSANGLVQFHSRHKYLVMSRSYSAYRSLGQLVAKAGSENLQQVAQQYITSLMQALSSTPERATQCNVLHHLMGYVKKQIDGQDKQELLHSIEDYRNGIVPLIVPVALLRHHLEREPETNDYALQQYYLKPYPHQLGLRSHVH